MERAPGSHTPQLVCTASTLPPQGADCEQSSESLDQAGCDMRPLQDTGQSRAEQRGPGRRGVGAAGARDSSSFHDDFWVLWSWATPRKARRMDAAQNLSDCFRRSLSITLARDMSSGDGGPARPRAVSGEPGQPPEGG